MLYSVGLHVVISLLFQILKTIYKLVMDWKMYKRKSQALSKSKFVKHCYNVEGRVLLTAKQTYVPQATTIHNAKTCLKSILAYS